MSVGVARAGVPRRCRGDGFGVCLRAQSDGLPPEWEVRKDLDSLVDQTRRLKPLLDAVKPAEWLRKGAPAAYEGQ